MSREIKFRGIHPQTGELMDVCVIDWMHDEVYFDQGTDVAYTIEQCKLIQYTGLKDRNGVDIYERDIVECWDTCGFENISQSLSGEVVFEGGCFCVKDNDGYHNRSALTCAENVEVTGNIHR